MASLSLCFGLGETVPWNSSERTVSEGAEWKQHRIIVQDLLLTEILTKRSLTVFQRGVILAGIKG